jgi:hypothetical protein
MKGSSDPKKFLNDQGSFRPMWPDEQGPIMQRLRQIGQECW